MCTPRRSAVLLRSLDGVTAMPRWLHARHCHSNFIVRFCRATLSRDKIASVTWRVAQLLNSRATPVQIRAALYSVQLCSENAVNADWLIPVYATKLQCATRQIYN